MELEKTPYDNAAKMRELRENRKNSLGLGKVNEELAVLDQQHWWKGQMKIATSYQLESQVARGGYEEHMPIAKMYVKRRAKLAEASDLVSMADDVTKPIAERYRDAILAQHRHKVAGAEAEEAGDTGIMMRHMAMEYVMALRAAGWYHLIRYYISGGTRPRIADDV